jgi:diaminopimelate epimerase
VQFVRGIDRATLQLEIWERGAGYTLASGSSSAAAAAVAHALDLCDANVLVHSPGGTAGVHVAAEGHVAVTVPVVKVWQGYLSPV